jgi:hypothetical protein
MEIPTNACKLKNLREIDICVFSESIGHTPPSLRTIHLSSPDDNTPQQPHGLEKRLSLFRDT